MICKLIGTQFDSVGEFLEKYKDDGFIWFLESCEMNSADIYRTLWQMKMNGWFKYSNGFMFGRPDGFSEVEDFSLQDAFKESLAEFKVPVIYNADIGHLPPQLTLINGSMAEVELIGGCGRIVQKKSK